MRLFGLPEGRGRLSSLDLLPEEAEEDVIWAYAELARRKRPSDDILESLNLRLKLKGIGPISRSAFGRKSMWLNRLNMQRARTYEVARVLKEERAAERAQRPDADPEDDLSLMIDETFKVIVLETLTHATIRADGESAEMIMNLARSLKYSGEARAKATDNRIKVRAVNDFKRDASRAIEKAGAARGLDAKTIESAKRLLLGLPAMAAVEAAVAEPPAEAAP